MPQLLKVMSRVAPAFYVDNLYGGIGRELSNGKISYRMYCFANELRRRWGRLIVAVANTPSDYTS